MFNVTTPKGHPLTLLPPRVGGRPGWGVDTRHWDFMVLSDSNCEYTGTFSAGPGIDYSDEDALHRSILESLAADVGVYESFGPECPVRGAMACLVDDFGMDDPLETYDLATALLEVGEWFDNLSSDEQVALRAYGEDDDD